MSKSFFPYFFSSEIALTINKNLQLKAVFQIVLFCFSEIVMIMILLITRMITDRIGLHSVLLPLLMHL